MEALSRSDHPRPTLVAGEAASDSRQRAVTPSGPASGRVAAWLVYAPDPVVVLDGDGRIVWGNAAAERVLGYELESATGMQALGLVHPEDLWEAADSLRTTLERPGVPGMTIPVRLRGADGKYVVCEVRGSNLLHDPDVRGVVLVVRDVSDRPHISQALADSESRFHAVARHASETILLLDELGRIEYVSPALVATTGWRPDDLIGHDSYPLVHPDDLRVMTDAAAPVLACPGASAKVEFRLQRPSGEWRHCEAQFVNLLDDPAVGRVALYVRDVTDCKAEEAARFASDERFRSAFENAPIGMAVQSLDGRLLQANNALAELLGQSREALAQTDMIRLVHPDDRVRGIDLAARAAAGELVEYRLEQRLLRADGRTVWVKTNVSIVHDEGGAPAYAISHLEDVTGRRRDEERLTYQARHDALTGLPNRTLLLDRLRFALDRAERGGPMVGVLFCDLDRFKVVNDSLGHQVGDKLLVECGRRLRAIIRSEDTLARFGGDEFVILCGDVRSREQVIGVADRVARALMEPFDVSGHEFVLSTSVGIAFSDDGASGPDELLRDADAAMYRAKEDGRARYSIFEPAMRSAVVERAQVERALRRAVEGDELELEYQPVVGLREGDVLGAEALVRWRRGDAVVPPSQFIPLAEETGLIVPIGLWVLDAACAQLGEWTHGDVGLPSDFRLTVNLSLRQLDSTGFTRHVEEAIARHRVEPAQLCFELTESALADDRSAATRVLRELRALGCGLAIDDFGTGYSMLSNLKRFPFDSLKIDRSFVSGLGRDPEDEAIVAAIVGIARALDLAVVGEGIELRSQAAALLEHGIALGQGYLFGAPCCPRSFLERLRGAEAISEG